MAIPKAVREQAEQAEKMAEEMGLTGKQPAAPAEPAPAQPAEPSTPKAVASNPNPNEDWEKRYKGLKKTHDTVVPELRQRIAQLEQQLDKAKAQPPAAPAAPATAPVSTDDVMAVLTDRERSEFTPEFIDMVVRVASRAAGGGSVDPNLDQRIKNLESTVTKTAEELFWDEIDRGIPDWKDLQATEDMQGWLLEYDDLLGMSRSQAVAAAQQNLDSRRVIAIYNQYKQKLSGRSLDTTPEGELITPAAQAGGGDSGAPPGKDTKIWTVGQIRQFYTDLAQGKYRGVEGRKKADAIEKQIEKARDEGRVTE